MGYLCVIQGDGRYTYMAKLVWATQTHLYVSDVSLSHSPTDSYRKIRVTPSCLLPSQKSGSVLLQDVLCDSGK